jgi:23S rRNA pseudouridine2457 synthase
MANTFLFNKPYDVLCQFKDSQKRKCLRDFILIQGIYAAGRLDRDSEGLVVLTDDGALNQKITNPERKVTKSYWVQVEGTPTANDLNLLATGLILKDGPTLPVRWALGRNPHSHPTLWPRTPPIRVRKSIPTTWLTMTLREGKNRQVRRMCAALGFPVLRLIRYRVGSWTIDGIAPGEFIAL